MDFVVRSDAGSTDYIANGVGGLGTQVSGRVRIDGGELLAAVNLTQATAATAARLP
jgi:hypothetical protein